jgi:predicted MPP superfamily phosphohydrolase
MVTAIAGGVQVPGVLAAGYLSGSYQAMVAGAFVITLPFLLGLRNHSDDRPKSWARLYLGLWPFFAWWTVCLVFWFLAPLGLAVAALTPVTLAQALAVSGAVAILVALNALRRRPQIREHTIPIAGLPPPFEGYRILQISDLHCGPFTPPARIERWVQSVNALEADLVAVTGDLITSGNAYVASVSGALGGLRARDGVYACMGNHDYFTDGEMFAGLLQQSGLEVLRNRGVTISRQRAQLYVAGVDDTWTHRNDVRGALAARPADAAAVLLAHDPNLFPQAAAENVDLTLSGHTHGGQFAAPGLGQMNLARLITPFTAGIYRIGGATLYVNRGLGTTGVPVRVGVAPEIAVFRLVRADPELASNRMQDLAEDAIREASEGA